MIVYQNPFFKYTLSYSNRSNGFYRLICFQTFQSRPRLRFMKRSTYISIKFRSFDRPTRALGYIKLCLARLRQVRCIFIDKYSNLRGNESRWCRGSSRKRRKTKGSDRRRGDRQRQEGGWYQEKWEVASVGRTWGSIEPSNSLYCKPSGVIREYESYLCLWFFVRLICWGIVLT